MNPRKPHGCCPVCGRYKRLTDAGMIKLHKRGEITCDGSLQAPKLPSPRKTDTWAAARKATIARDGGRCQKCQLDGDLEVHHIKERTFGGTDDLENLITLCHDCHCEWTFCQPPLEFPFDMWLAMPPARFVVVVLSKKWPADIDAESFRQQLLAMFSQMHDERRKRSSPG